MTSVLIVDDEFDLASTLRAILEDEGYKATVQSNGRRALEYLQGKPAVDVVLVDLMMPYMDGLELIQCIRAHPECARVPIVLMSGVRPQSDAEREPWDVFLRKPFGVQALLETVRRLVGSGGAPAGREGPLDVPRGRTHP